VSHILKKPAREVVLSGALCRTKKSICCVGSHSALSSTSREYCTAKHLVYQILVQIFWFIMWF